jgi:hypothetical protein
LLTRLRKSCQLLISFPYALKFFRSAVRQASISKVLTSKNLKVISLIGKATKCSFYLDGAVSCEAQASRKVVAMNMQQQKEKDIVFGWHIEELPSYKDSSV